MDINLLRMYKEQNPIKYKQKFGDKSPEEILLPVAPPTVINGVKIEMKPKTEVEMEFKAPVETPIEPQVTVSDLPKKKSGRRPKDA